MCCLNWWAASATISWKASSIWLIIPVWNSCQGCSMLKRVWVELLTKMRRALKDQAKSEWMILGVKHFHSARNLWLYCKDPPKGNIWMNCPLYNENEVDIKKSLKKQTMMRFRYNWHIIPLTEFREADPIQNGWIFGKVPNDLWPPPPHFRKIMLNFFRKTSKKSLI